MLRVEDVPRFFALRSGLLVCLGLTVAVCAPEAPHAGVGVRVLPENPLPPCPASPNCVRETRLFDTSPEALFRKASDALQAMGVSEVAADVERRRLHAVFTLFFFKDDVAIAVAPWEDGSVLHIRSASRVGSSDLGVNRRRVNLFFRALAETR